MITLNITADTPADFTRQLLALAASMGASTDRMTQPVEETEEQEEAPKPRRRSSAAKPAETGSEKEATAKSADGEKSSPDKEPEEKAATKKAAQSSASDDVDVTDYDSVKKFLGTAITTLGAQLVQEAMAEQGATKVGDLAPTKYKPLVARLQDLMDRKDEE